MPVFVKDIMSKPVLQVDLNTNVKVAGELMAKTRKDSLIVTKGNKPIGILTDSDLIKKVVAKNIKPSSIKAKDIMSEPLVSVVPEETILNASRKMKKNNIKRLPVISKEKVVGILSTTDIARTTPEMVDILEYKLKTKELPVEIKEKQTSGICDSCGNFSDVLENANDQWLCENCREELKAEV